jgi:hypothetical protein
VSDPARQLSDPELAALAGISARCWASYTEPALIVSGEDPTELIPVMWNYAAKLGFVLAVVLREREHAVVH